MFVCTGDNESGICLEFHYLVVSKLLCSLAVCHVSLDVNVVTRHYCIKSTHLIILC